MKLEIKKVSLQNFKGCKDKTIEFDGNSKIVGENGAGKSTIASAVSWVMADTDYNLVKNPSVIPMGMTECEIKVEIEFELDGKPLTVAKIQKNKSKEIDGKVTSSSTNVYSINGINKTLKDFTSDLESRGIDLENYLIYTNPNSFLADTSKSGRDKIRKILFEMASDVTDEDIAKEIGAKEVVKAMSEKGYKLDEIKALAKGTISKITSENGKNNELINAKIDGMLSSKSNVDEKVLTEQKKNYESELARIEKELSGMADGKTEISKKLSELHLKKDEMARKSTAHLREIQNELEQKIHDCSRIIDESGFQLEQTKTKIARTESSLVEKKEDIKKQRTLYKVEQDAVLDEGDLVCPTCKRTYSKTKLAEIKADFEKHKVERMKLIKETGDNLKEQISEAEKILKTLKEKERDLLKVIDATQAVRAEAQNKLDNCPSGTFTDDGEYLTIMNEISKLEVELSKTDTSRVEELNSQRNVNKAMLNQIIAELGTLEQNDVIDEKVAKLRQKRKDDEIAKAKAEKILDEVSQVEMAKNTRLAESINANFDLVEWHLWDRQKNGAIIEVTEPYIDGKPMTSAANGSLITLAKISICADLQRHFGQIMPIWCDDYGLFSSNTSSRIDIESQLIGLVVTEDKELVIENA